ncbi:DNA replication terminus site-binding protein [Pseudoalteromonas denitrificans]|nr:DNA replication terminus site-binding protein [Pseudoalteromonas denitrificans]
MDLKFNVRTQFENVTSLINQLIIEISQQKLIYARYYQLPEMTAQDENKSVKEISVNAFSGNIAFDKCCAAFNDFYKKNNLSGRIIKRHPGIIALESKKPELIESRIKQINSAKNELKKIIVNAGNNDARFDLVHSAVPNLITLCAYRNIHFESQSPYSIRFTWMNKHSIKLLSKSDALSLLNNSETFGNSKVIDLLAWQQLVQKEKLNIASIKDSEKLRIRRPTRVSPQVNIRYDAKNRYHVSAALPFILINPEENVKYGTLKNYIKPEHHPRKKQTHYLIERLYLEKNS